MVLKSDVGINPILRVFNIDTDITNIPIAIRRKPISFFLLNAIKKIPRNNRTDVVVKLVPLKEFMRYIGVYTTVFFIINIIPTIIKDTPNINLRKFIEFDTLLKFLVIYSLEFLLKSELVFNFIL